MKNRKKMSKKIMIINAKNYIFLIVLLPQNHTSVARKSKEKKKNYALKVYNKNIDARI